ncbi:hypothetical protein INT48_008817 [Thamnidium elegans]|uniref:Uncharacterized protein n=1 Tax=Thamnidium elegans TaxID=101142 RepID=A0A8H7VY64_9FUNG|nr:hypothetical protein INT48_008817 [Thamnidium elegans]
MSTTTEPTIDPVVTAPAPVAMETPATETTQETPVVVEEPAVESTETAVESADATVEPTTEETAVEEVAAKPTVTKRRTIFNPFGKAAKKEESKKEESKKEESKKEEVKEDTAPTEEGFGFFSRSKSSPKVNEEENTKVATTELPQIEQLQPIETDNITGTEESAPPTTTVTEAVTEAAEQVEQKATEVTQEVEQSAANLSTAVANKRQSFISKLFEATAITNNPTTEEVVEQQQTEETEAPAQQRPSSPLGRLTELFTSKKNNKKAASTAPAKEEAPAVVVTEVEQDVVETNIEENANVTATPVVTASA